MSFIDVVYVKKEVKYNADYEWTKQNFLISNTVKDLDLHQSYIYLIE